MNRSIENKGQKYGLGVLLYYALHDVFFSQGDFKVKEMLKTWVTTKKGNQFEIMLPAHRIVCPRCHGLGVHDPTAFANGVELDVDPEFKESYFRGDYDVRCEECQGENVVLAVNVGALTPKMRERYYRAEDELAAHKHEAATEGY